MTTLRYISFEKALQVGQEPEAYVELTWEDCVHGCANFIDAEVEFTTLKIDADGVVRDVTDDVIEAHAQSLIEYLQDQDRMPVWSQSTDAYKSAYGW